eukprot:scaffold123211_cov18-Tisochrysis_lutea.AAC.1
MAACHHIVKVMKHGLPHFPPFSSAVFIVHHFLALNFKSSNLQHNARPVSMSESAIIFAQVLVVIMQPMFQNLCLFNGAMTAEAKLMVPRNQTLSLGIHSVRMANQQW